MLFLDLGMLLEASFHLLGINYLPRHVPGSCHSHEEYLNERADRTASGTPHPLYAERTNSCGCWSRRIACWEFVSWLLIYNTIFDLALPLIIVMEREITLTLHDLGEFNSFCSRCGMPSSFSFCCSAIPHWLSSIVWWTLFTLFEPGTIMFGIWT